MKTIPPVTVVHEGPEDVFRRLEAWRANHPGYDASNFADAFRDANGELIESAEFFEACDLFAALKAIG